MAAALAECGCVGLRRSVPTAGVQQAACPLPTSRPMRGKGRRRGVVQGGLGRSPTVLAASSRGGDTGDWAEFLEHDDSRTRRGFSHTSSDQGGRAQRQKAPSPAATPLEAVNAAEAARTNLFASVAAVRSALDGSQAQPSELSATSSTIREMLNQAAEGAVSSSSSMGLNGRETGAQNMGAAIYASNLGGSWGGPLDVVETIPLVKVVFQMTLKVSFGESVRLIGGHAALGGWDAKKSIQLRWSPGDTWKSDEVELPVNSIYVYKYVVCSDSVPSAVKLWQQGNNQALMLSAADQPLLHVLDSWRGDSGSSYSCAADGSNRRQPSDRLTQVFLEREAEMSDLRHRVSSLSKELQVKSLEVTALRTEAKLSAKRRVDLQDALEIERSRVKDLTSRVGAWQVAFGRIKEKVKARLESGETASLPALPPSAGASSPALATANVSAAAASPAVAASGAGSNGYASDYLRKRMEERLASARAAAAVAASTGAPKKGDAASGKKSLKKGDITADAERTAR